MWQPDLSSRTGPLYLGIADRLAEDVRAGRLREGDRLPTQRSLAEQLGVTVGTVTRAYAEAGRRGLIGGEVGRGTFVRGMGEDPARFMERAFFPDRASGVPANAPVDDGTVDFTINRPLTGDTPSLLAASLAAISQRPDLASFLGYVPALGLASHREAGAAWCRRAGLGATADRIIVCQGAQHAMAVSLMAYARPGATVLTEAFTYHGAKALAALLCMNVKGIAMDREGILPDAFDAACRANDVAVLYCVPTMQNPTTAVMPEERRHAIVEIARRHGVAIVEDDVFGFLAEGPDGTRTPPIAALAPDITHFVTSLSKCASPGLRAGYLCVPEGTADRIAAGVRTTVAIGVSLTAEVAAGWIRDGTIDRLAAFQREEAAARQKIARSILGQFDYDARPAGFHIWLRLPEVWTPGQFVSLARARGVLLTAADAFSIDRAMRHDRVRICLQAPATREQVERGLSVLAGMLAANPDNLQTIV